MTTHSFSFEYEQADITYNVEAEVDLLWQGAEPDVGIMSAWAENEGVTSVDIDGTSVLFNKETKAWDLSAFPAIDAEAFEKRLEAEADKTAETAEPPEYDGYDDY